MKNKFEDYLMEVHAKQYTGLDDDMPDDYEKWVSELDCNDIIEYAGKAIQSRDKEIIEKLKERFSKEYPINFTLEDIINQINK